MRHPAARPAATPTESEHPVTAALRELAAQEITVRLVTPEEEPRWNKLVRQRHYLHEHRLVGESLKYVAEQHGQWLALLGWSSAAYHLQARDHWIGWSPVQRQSRRQLLACNARFLLLRPKAHAPNVASQILSRNLQRLSQDWQQRYTHPILLVETFVDPQQFQGTCYRATNWIEIGTTKGFGRARLDFYQLHAQPKAIFLYPLQPNARQLLAAPVLPLPLKDSEQVNPTQYPLSLRQTDSLLDAFEALPDPRSRQGRLHRRVSSILAIATAAIIAGNNTFSAIGEFAQSLNQNQLRSLRARRDRRRGQYLAPSESTIRRTLQAMDPAALDQAVSGWLRAQLQDQHLEVLAVDGKCARTAAKITGQALHLFGALDVQRRLVQAQLQIPAKTNEIPALADLLRDLDLRGTLVSADALHTQKATARFLVENKQADYLLPVKANQPKLFGRLQKLAHTAAFFPSAHRLGPGARPA
jgi:hypothetical protein